MRKPLLSFLGLVVLLFLLGFLYVWSFRTAHVIQHASGLYELSICGIRVPFTEVADATANRVYAPLRRWHAERIPKRTVEGTIRSISWEEHRLSISVPSRDGVGCRFDERLAGVLKTLKEGDAVRATIGWSPGRSFIVYDYKLDALSVDAPTTIGVGSP